MVSEVANRSLDINAVQKLIIQDRHVIYCEIKAALGISSTSIYKILHEHLAVRKICSRWIVSHLYKDTEIYALELKNICIIYFA